MCRNPAIWKCSRSAIGRHVLRNLAFLAGHSNPSRAHLAQAIAACVRGTPTIGRKEGTMIENFVVRLMLVASVFAAHAAFAADPIKFGVSIALSPPGSVPQATQVRDASVVATKMINDAGGVLGRPVELVIEDDQGIPEKARAAAEKLITRDKVVAFVGGHQSSAVLAAIEVAHRYHVPYINTNGTADAIREKGYVEVFNPIPYNSRVAIGTAAALKDLGVKRAIGLCENTDYGIGMGKVVGDQIKEQAPNIDYKFETLDRTGKDFLPALLSMKANPPDVVINCMLPPAAYILINQLYEQGISPAPHTWLFDVSAVTDYPDFWRNVSDAAKSMIAFDLYHPRMPMSDLGKKLAAEYKAKTSYEPARLLFQAADSLFVAAEAIKAANSTEPEAMIKALENLKWGGTHGEVTFSTEKRGYRYHQWIDVPYVIGQITAVNQPVGDTKVLQDVGKPFDASQLVKPR
jgi:branched-chain amino acid transport system substrate-binding protein